jgi:hypothetical protein
MTAPPYRADVLAAAVTKVLGDRVKAASAAAKDSVLAAGVPGDRVTPRLPDGTPVRGASVTITEGRRSLVVTDERAFRGWVKTQHPTEVVTVEQVRPSYVDALRATVDGPGPVFDPATGEEIPGLEVSDGAPYVSVRATAPAVAAIEQAWQGGTLLRDVLALPAEGDAEVTG